MTSAMAQRDHAPEEEHDVAQLVAGVVDHPRLESGGRRPAPGWPATAEPARWAPAAGRADPPLPEAPVVARQPVGAAKALHQREHQAQAGKDREAGGGEDQLRGVKAAGLHRGLQQGHRVGGQKLLEGGANLAHQRGSLRHLGQQRGQNHQRRKERQHSRIGGGLGRVEHVVLKSQPEGFAEMANVSRPYASQARVEHFGGLRRESFVNPVLELRFPPV